MLVRRTSASKVVWYESPLLAAAGLPHGFSTRLGGVSEAPFDSLNLGNPGGCPVQDRLERIEENYRRLKEAIGVADRRLLRVHQVHGDQVVVAGDGDGCDGSAKADAVVATGAGDVASVRVADCTPVLLATADGLAVAAVHAGWRGVIAGVVAAAAAKLREINPKSQILAAIGPCIGMEAFEVGPEVLEAFASAFGPDAPIRRLSDGKGHVDLRRAIVRQLESCGLTAGGIDRGDRCTVRDADEFFSHRRDKGVTGRMAALIGAKPTGAPPRRPGS